MPCGRADQLGAAQRGQLLDDLEGEADELTRLVNEVVDLATDRRNDEPDQPVDLGALVERVATRAAQRTGRHGARSSRTTPRWGRDSRSRWSEPWATWWRTP